MRRGFWRLAAFSVLALLLAVGLQQWEVYQYRVLDCPSAARMAERSGQWRSLYPGRPVDHQVIQQSLLDEDMLVKEALLQGVHREDLVIHQRLQRDAIFLDLDDRALDRHSPLLEAIILGDVVIRRRLLQRMEAELVAPAAALHAGPDAAVQVDLQQYLFSQPDIARQALERGDYSAAMPFLYGAGLTGLSETSLAALFGENAALTIQSMPVGEWFGPVHSDYGWHLLRIAARRDRQLKIPPPSPGLSAEALKQLRGKYRSRCDAP